MDVNELAPSLLALGDLVRASNTHLNGDRAEVSVRVRSDFKKGSFEVALLLDHNLLEQAKQLLLPGGATVGGAALVAFLFGKEAAKKGAIGVVESVLDLWKKVHGEKPKETIEDSAKGITIFVLGDGSQVNVNPVTATLYGSSEVRKAMAGIVGPVSTDGINLLEIKRGEKTINQVRKTDLPAVPGTTEGTTTRDAGKIQSSTREAVLRVSRANFEKGKWGFSDGAASFSADITDEVFRRGLDAREIGFYKGDTLRVVLTVTQNISKEGQPLGTNYEIEKVLAHTHAPRQAKIPVMESGTRKIDLKEDD